MKQSIQHHPTQPSYHSSVRHVPTAVATVIALLQTSTLRSQDPLIESWRVDGSRNYARIYLNDAAKSTGTAVATWSNGSQSQSLPAYAGVQEVSSSADWVYIRTSGLALHVMGPWLNGQFPNLPSNRKAHYRIPRKPSVGAVKSLTGLGTIGFFVDGVAMFDSRDGFVWNGSAEAGNGTGYWNREAYVNEGATFDPGYAHQENTGTHHYHANPIALRYLLGDHVDYHPETKTYSESTAPVTEHSPILGWVRDGFPVYGPYGFGVATNASSGLRRMLSGYQLRNGEHGTEDLRATGRTSIPLWGQRLYNVAANQAGPAVSTQYPLGRYMEDNAYLGDLTNLVSKSPYVQGTDFDLDEYNGRWCVTPEYPNGTYAYFVSIAADGTPVFPYNIGRAYYGIPSGAAVTGLNESVVTNAVGGAESPIILSPLHVQGGKFTLVWSAVEGGSYQIESTSAFNLWNTLATGLIASARNAQYTTSAETPMSVVRVNRSGLAEYDPVTGTPTNGGGGDMGGPALAAIQPTTGTRGTTLQLVATLGGNPPPADVSPRSATLGSISGTNIQRNGTSVTATFAIPSNTPTGAVTVSIVFPGPPGQGDATFSLANGFMIQ